MAAANPAATAARYPGTSPRTRTEAAKSSGSPYCSGRKQARISRLLSLMIFSRLLIPMSKNPVRGNRNPRCSAAVKTATTSAQKPA